MKRVILADVARRAGRLADGRVVRPHRPARGDADLDRRRVPGSCGSPRISATGPTSSRGACAPGRPTRSGSSQTRSRRRRFAGNLIKGALEAARDRGHLLLIAETEGDPKLEQELLESDGRPPGRRDRVGVDVHPQDRSSEAVEVARSRPPERRAGATRDLISVIPDELAGGRMAAETLIGAGHRGGIYLSAPDLGRPRPRPPGASPRSNDSRASSGSPRRRSRRPAGAIACVEWEPELGYAAVQTLIKQGAKLEALICFNDRLALGAYNALADAGLAVPIGRIGRVVRRRSDRLMDATAADDNRNPSLRARPEVDRTAPRRPDERQVERRKGHSNTNAAPTARVGKETLRTPARAHASIGAAAVGMRRCATWPIQPPSTQQCCGTLSSRASAT